MNSCPPELHSYIVRLACADDGSTVRALLRVSRYYHAIAVPFIYQSMALDGEDRISKVAATLEKMPSHRRRIRHLFISDAPSSPPSSSKREREDRDPTVETAMIKILHFAAPTLESLTFLATTPCTSTCLISQLFRHSFPRLLELTVHGYYPFPSMPASMPVLQRLHLSGNRNPHGLFQLGGLEASCPSISHLRISGVERAVAFANELESLLQQSSSPQGCIASGQQVLFPTTLPKQLRILIVQTAPVSVKSVRSARLTKDMMRVLEGLDRGVRGDNGRPSFHCLDGRDADDGDESKRLKADWEDRLSGGEGCWASSA
ncbi:hypothetical protein CCMSSC00406_0010327 [Pleurotus cornucopiae]|uniref:Uncharacterized protein n=1 Tax=Pleurotus cornucopiae TaxID=5321 RepID=A0ACB7IQ41_PLECO|nr:hypothetical protein CCMSSC00406_0010327 [Pleurotus cornucopiae]